MKTESMIYQVRRNFPQPYRGRHYRAGDTITSADIDSYRRERQFVSLQWIVPISVATPAPTAEVAAEEEQPEEAAAPARKRGRWGQQG